MLWSTGHRAAAPAESAHEAGTAIFAVISRFAQRVFMGGRWPSPLWASAGRPPALTRNIFCRRYALCVPRQSVRTQIGPRLRRSA